MPKKHANTFLVLSTNTTQRFYSRIHAIITGILIIQRIISTNSDGIHLNILKENESFALKRKLSFRGSGLFRNRLAQKPNSLPLHFLMAANLDTLFFLLSSCQKHSAQQFSTVEHIFSALYAV